MCRTLIFSPHHIKLIFDEKKTMTRRLSGRYEPRKLYAVQPGRGEKAVAWIRIISKKRQLLSKMTEEDALKEGGYTLEEFIALWKEMHHMWTPDMQVWVYEFELEMSERDKQIVMKRLRDWEFI